MAYECSKKNLFILEVAWCSRTLFCSLWIHPKCLLDFYTNFQYHTFISFALRWYPNLSIGAIILFSCLFFSAVAPYFLLLGVSFGLCTGTGKKKEKKIEKSKKLWFHCLLSLLNECCWGGGQIISLRLANSLDLIICLWTLLPPLINNKRIFGFIR